MIEKFIERLDENEKDSLLKITLEELEIQDLLVFPKDGSEPYDPTSGESIIDGL